MTLGLFIEPSCYCYILWDIVVVGRFCRNCYLNICTHCFQWNHFKCVHRAYQKAYSYVEVKYIPNVTANNAIATLLVLWNIAEFEEHCLESKLLLRCAVRFDKLNVMHHNGNKFNAHSKVIKKQLYLFKKDRFICHLQIFERFY